MQGQVEGVYTQILVSKLNLQQNNQFPVESNDWDKRVGFREHRVLSIEHGLDQDVSFGR